MHPGCLIPFGSEDSEVTDRSPGGRSLASSIWPRSWRLSNSKESSGAGSICRNAINNRNDICPPSRIDVADRKSGGGGSLSLPQSRVKIESLNSVQALEGSPHRSLLQPLIVILCIIRIMVGYVIR